MFKNKNLQVLVIGILLCVIYAWWLAALRPVQIANLKVLDAFFYLNSKLNPLPKAGQDIVLITVDDSSLREVNIRWP